MDKTSTEAILIRFEALAFALLGIETIQTMRGIMNMYQPKNIVAATICVLSVLIAIPTTVSANTGRWAQNHPRRTEVNSRLANQNRRIYQERREGEINRRQAAQLHKQAHQIRGEERLMASRNGGHITRQEQRILNRQENQLSREIGR